MPQTLSLIAALTLLPACFGSHGRDDTPMSAPGLAHDERFVGDWRVTSARGWALLPATTVYRFREDGVVEVVFHEDGTYFAGEAGRWVRADGVVCVFGDRWWSEGRERLEIESLCDDGDEAVAALEFPFDEALNTTLPEPSIVAPRGAVGMWGSEEPQGSFRRCVGAGGGCD